MKIEFWKPELSEDFKNLNLQWLEEFFWVEEHDREVLGNPEKHIIAPGGNILFVMEEEEAVACVALMKISEGIFELTKMAVKPALRGKKIGNRLLEETINFSKKQNWDELIIYSNTKLENAIHLYRKFGFIEIPMEQNGPYSRGNIKMRLNLS
ncbi:GNAT family N-acetyltransferase [Christiangramia flava]|uniref:Transcriptional regulator, MarR family n=1 Tax=Christiangramia flava JLT2011 TaxID=1229726 RepID=A0A1L7I6V9_9FLAO|nr:GNAT family N-acetyltransferase [Christiangramia flava]APU69338.1 Transcriptional regulator, MarR family [Christiangramia flava JLT2011]